MPNQQEMLATILTALAGNSNIPQQLAKQLGISTPDREYTVEVVRTGDKMIVPEGADLHEVQRAIERKIDYEEQWTRAFVSIPVAPWDGARAVVSAVEEILGVVFQKDDGGGANSIDVEVELGKTVRVPWGEFELPNTEGGTINMGTTREHGRIVFRAVARYMRRYEARVQRVLDNAKERAVRESMHRGKAFTMVFRDEDGDRISMPMPRFFESALEEPIFTRAIERMIDRNVFTVLKHADVLRAAGKSLKRGVLFAGPYGVGKTLLASHLAKMATRHGWTFIYVKDSEELPEALQFAQQFQPVLVFAEDVDRIAGMDRDNDVNELLNQLDGIDSKGAQILTVLTTNHPEKINPAMRRPGRIDTVIEVAPPDAETVIRMFENFGAGRVDMKSDLVPAAELLAGNAPARVREAVTRAEFEVLRRTGSVDEPITGEDLLAVAQEIEIEANLFAPPAHDHGHSLEVAADTLEQMAEAVRSVKPNGDARPHIN